MPLFPPLLLDNTVTVTDDATATDGQRVLCDLSTKSIAITLSGVERIGVMLYVASGTRTVTITPTTGTVNGVSSVVMYVSGDYLEVLWNATTSDWMIINDHRRPSSSVRVSTPSGHGSTNTKIRRFSVTEESFGNAITYASSSTLGDSFTINIGGVYSILYTDTIASLVRNFGASRNASGAQLTTNVWGLPYPVLIGVQAMPTSSTGSFAATLRLTAGDVIRAHTTGDHTGTSSFDLFAISHVSH